jgi:glycosyltransferase involved in cell wall biosynthesis
LQSVTSGLRERGDRVVIVSGHVQVKYGSDARRRAIEAAALDWIVLDGFRGTNIPRPAHVRKILKTVDDYSVDVVSPQGFAALPMARLIGSLRSLPVIANFHLVSAEKTELSLQQIMAYRAVCAIARSDRYIAMSTDIEEFFLGSCRIASDRIQKLLLGVDTEFFYLPDDDQRAVSRREFAIGGDALVVVMPARLNSSKGHDIVTASVRQLRARHSELQIVCLFAGDGDDREAILSEAHRDTADRLAFRFLGYVDRPALRSAYWASDLVVCPSRVEGFGLGVAEAMCCGAAAIRTPGGGWRDQIVEGETGFMVPFDDPAALANAIERFAYAADRRAMRRSAAAFASSVFARSRMIDQTSSLYREAALLARRNRRTET